jgi:hypothetical protein
MIETISEFLDRWRALAPSLVDAIPMGPPILRDDKRRCPWEIVHDWKPHTAYLKVQSTLQDVVMCAADFPNGEVGSSKYSPMGDLSAVRIAMEGR